MNRDLAFGEIKTGNFHKNVQKNKVSDKEKQLVKIFINSSCLVPKPDIFYLFWHWLLTKGEEKLSKKNLRYFKGSVLHEPHRRGLKSFPCTTARWELNKQDAQLVTASAHLILLTLKKSVHCLASKRVHNYGFSSQSPPINIIFAPNPWHYHSVKARVTCSSEWAN